MNTNLVDFKNPEREYTIKREKFSCAEFSFDTVEDKELLANLFEEAKNLSSRVNPTQASTSLKRDTKTLYMDSLAGVIAEYVVKEYINSQLERDVIIKPISNSAINQVDLLTIKNNTIEVRSSFARNGIEFALFNKDKRGMQYFDVLGPYSNNSYKPVEDSLKDFYARIIFQGNKTDLKQSLEEFQPYNFYFIGGATKTMMRATELTKYMTPKNGDVSVSGKYKVIPIGNALDINEFIKELEKCII